jgi:hypothetical protein
MEFSVRLRALTEAEVEQSEMQVVPSRRPSIISEVMTLLELPVPVPPQMQFF